MREMLSETGSSELVYWLAFLRLDDERRGNEVAVAVNRGFAGDS